jgi:hypothetical protein
MSITCNIFVTFKTAIPHLVLAPGDGLHQAGDAVLVTSVRVHPGRQSLRHDGRVPIPAGLQEQGVPGRPGRDQLRLHPWGRLLHRK